MFKAGVQFVYGVHMHAGLMGKRTGAHIGQVARKDQVRGIRQRNASSGKVFHLFLGNAGKAGLELQVGKQRRKVGIAAALTQAEQRALHLLPATARPESLWQWMPMVRPGNF